MFVPDGWRKPLRVGIWAQRCTGIEPRRFLVCEVVVVIQFGLRRWSGWFQHEDLANIFIIPTVGGDSIRVTEWGGYDGAPSWSPDGSLIAFESYPGDPDDSSGTTLWLIDAPDVL